MCRNLNWLSLQTISIISSLIKIIFDTSYLSYLDRCEKSAMHWNIFNKTSFDICWFTEIFYGGIKCQQRPRAHFHRLCHWLIGLTSVKPFWRNFSYTTRNLLNKYDIIYFGQYVFITNRANGRSLSILGFLYGCQFIRVTDCCLFCCK